MDASSDNCFFWPKQPSRCKTVMILQYFCSSISFIFLFCVIGIIILFKLYKMFVQRLILFMCCCSFVNTIMYFVHPSKVNITGCTFEGFLNQFMSWTELLWVCVITGNMFLSLHGYDLKNHEKKIHAFVWLTSLFWSIIPLFGMNYGPAGSWCWIKREQTSLRFGVWYVPLILVILVMFVVSIHTLCCMSSNQDVDHFNSSVFEQQQTRSLRQNEVRPLVAYPIIYLIFNLPILIYRIDDAVHPNMPPNYTLMILSVIFSPMLGAFNAVAFCIIEDTLKVSCSISVIKNILLCQGETTRITHNYEVVDENEPVASDKTSPNRSYDAV